MAGVRYFQQWKNDYFLFASQKLILWLETSSLQSSHDLQVIQNFIDCEVGHMGPAPGVESKNVQYIKVTTFTM